MLKRLIGAIAPAILDLAPAQAQGGLAQLDKMMMRGVQGYENIRNRIDDAESQMISKVGDVMSKVGAAQKKLQGQDIILISLRQNFL